MDRVVPQPKTCPHAKTLGASRFPSNAEAQGGTGIGGIGRGVGITGEQAIVLVEVRGVSATKSGVPFPRPFIGLAEGKTLDQGHRGLNARTESTPPRLPALPQGSGDAVPFDLAVSIMQDVDVLAGLKLRPQPVHQT